MQRVEEGESIRGSSTRWAHPRGASFFPVARFRVYLQLKAGEPRAAAPFESICLSGRRVGRKTRGRGRWKSRSKYCVGSVPYQQALSRLPTAHGRKLRWLFSSVVRAYFSSPSLYPSLSLFRRGSSSLLARTLPACRGGPRLPVPTPLGSISREAKQ